MPASNDAAPRQPREERPANWTLNVWSEARLKGAISICGITKRRRMTKIGGGRRLREGESSTGVQMEAG